MGTRGIWGLRKKGHTIAVYHHFDSYPEGLGYGFTEFLKKNTNEKLTRFFDHIVEIDEKVQPTEEQVQYCIQMGWCDLNVSSRSTADWYCLLRETQEPENWQFAVDHGKTVYVENYTDFIKDSLFCEYAYIYDIDSEVLELYKGFQHEPQESNPYGCEKDEDGYYPCKMVGAICKEDVDGSTVKEIVRWMNSCLEEEENA
jgi:hypothetical protein